MSIKMQNLPVIVGMGGINAAGRSSGFHSYKRMICDVLSQEELNDTWQDLANRMGIIFNDELTSEDIQAVQEGTLVRKIDSFDTEKVIYHHKARLDSSTQESSFVLKTSKLPKIIPEEWKVEELSQSEVKV